MELKSLFTKYIIPNEQFKQLFEKKEFNHIGSTILANIKKNTLQEIYMFLK